VASTGATALSANTIVLTAASATSTSSGSTDSFGASVGYQIGLGGQGPTASLNIAAGQNQATSTSLLDTHVTGSNVSIYSKGDTTLAGATVTGDTVRATVGGDLTIQTVAGTTGSASNSSWSVNLNGSKTTPNGGGSATSQLGAGFTIGSGSGSTSWIDELSGIAGGDVKVDVTGHTQLNAGIIDGDLTTGTLGYTNLTGRDASQQIDVGLSGSTSWTGGKDKPTPLVPDNGVLQGSYSSTDKEQQALATVTGNVTIIDKSGQTQDLSSLNKNSDKFLTITKDDQINFSFYVSTNSIKTIESGFSTLSDSAKKLERDLINIAGVPADVANAAAQVPEFSEGRDILTKLQAQCPPGTDPDVAFKALAALIKADPSNADLLYNDLNPQNLAAANTDGGSLPDGTKFVGQIAIDGHPDQFEDALVARWAQRQLLALNDFENRYPGVIDKSAFAVSVGLAGPLEAASQLVQQTVLKKLDANTGGYLEKSTAWLTDKGTELVKQAHSAYYDDGQQGPAQISDQDALTLAELGAMTVSGIVTGKLGGLLKSYTEKMGKIVANVLPKRIEKYTNLTLPGMSRPVRAPNPDFPPNQSIIDAMKSPKIQKMVNNTDCVDCSEIAESLLSAANGKGKIYQVQPERLGTLNVFENGRQESGMDYHQVYSDGQYVYDPRISTTPIPLGDWLQSIRNSNPDGIKLSVVGGS
jgi:hypothetical protein